MIYIEKDQIKKVSPNLSIGSGLGDYDKQVSDLKKALEKYKMDENIVDCKSHISIKDLKTGDKFYGSITTTIKDKDTGKKVRTNITDTFEMLENMDTQGRIKVKDSKGNIYRTSNKGTKLRSLTLDAEKQLEKKKLEEEIKKLEEQKKILQEKGIDFNKSDTPTRLKRVIEAGIKNIWLCGPAGSGNKSY